MAKLTFPTLIAPVYAKAVSLIRTHLVVFAENARKSPGLIPDLAASLQVLTTKLGVSLAAAGVPAQPTSLVAVPGTTGIVYLAFAAGVNSTTFEYAVSTDGGTSYGAAVALPSNRTLTGIAAGSKIFKVRGVNADPLTSPGVYSAAAAAITVL